jgi:hypothetical protein
MRLYAWLPFWCLSNRENGLSGVWIDVEGVHGVVKRGGEFLQAYFDSAVDVGVEGVVAWECIETEGGTMANLVYGDVHGEDSCMCIEHNGGG